MGLKIYILGIFNSSCIILVLYESLCCKCDCVRNAKVKVMTPSNVDVVKSIQVSSV